ncbi:MAG: hypothetical protein KDJ15_06515, partial [Alphaproteobacteria bacterium]|nr:hypothetical protein [Alphaproteobacteria bacterium]
FVVGYVDPGNTSHFLSFHILAKPYTDPRVKVSLRQFVHCYGAFHTKQKRPKSGRFTRKKHAFLRKMAAL